MQKPKISFIQLTSVLLICRITDILIYVRQNQSSGYNAVLTVLCSLALNLILVLPIYYLIKRNPDKSLFEIIKERTPLLSHVFLWRYYIVTFTLLLVNLIYINYAAADLSLSGRHAGIIILLVIPVLVYCALKGIEAISRLSFIMCIFAIPAVIFIFISGLTAVKSYYIQPLFSQNTNVMLSSLLFYLTGFYEIIIFAGLAPYTRKKQYTAFSIFIAISAILSIMTVLLTSFIYGSYTNNEMFPFITSLAVAKIGIQRRLDLIFLTLWVILAVIKSIIFFYLSSDILNAIFPKTNRKATVYITGILLFTAALIMYIFKIDITVYLTNKIYAVTFILSTTAIPILYTLIEMVRKKGRTKENES